MLDSESLDFAISSLSNRAKWYVSYSGALPGDDAMRAIGAFTNMTSGGEFDFESRSHSSCMREIVPEPGPWVYVEHDGWDNVVSPGVFTPMTPLAFFRIDPTPDWTVLDIIDEVILGLSPLEGGGFENL